MKLSLRTPLAIAALAALFAAAPADAQSRAPKLDRVLQNAQGGGRQRVIVRFKPGTASRLEQRIASAGNRIFAKHASIGAMTAELRADQFAAFANDPDVESIGADVDVAPFASTTDTSSISSSVLRNTLAEGQYSKGAGIGVAIIESGIAPLPAFYGRITAFYDVTSGVPVPTAAFDDYGHGTHVAGLIGADDSNYMGVAPGVTFVGLKVLNKLGKGATSSVITAIEFAVANRERFNIRVINLSLGHPILAPAANDPLVQAVESATRAGVIVVVSAGNVGINPDTGLIGYAGVTSPGNSPSAITVGAVDTHNTVTHGDDDVPAYSSRGPTWYDGLVKPDVVAPGHSMNS